MRHTLKALGFWIWGLIAISIAAGVAPLGYRVAALWRLHEISDSSDPSAPGGTAPTPSPADTDFHPTAKISRLIATDMTEAQEDLQASRWADALKHLDAAEQKSPLTPYDKNKIYDFKGFAFQKATDAELFTEQKEKDRAARLLNTLKPRADADKKDAAKFDAEAAKNPAGELDVRSGEVFFGAGDYQSAVNAINRGLQKGPNALKHLDEAYVYLGRSQLALKNAADAANAFAHLRTMPNISDRVLRLWTLYAETELSAIDHT